MTGACGVPLWSAIGAGLAGGAAWAVAYHVVAAFLRRRPVTVTLNLTTPPGAVSSVEVQRMEAPARG